MAFKRYGGPGPAALGERFSSVGGTSIKSGGKLGRGLRSVRWRGLLMFTFVVIMTVVLLFGFYWQANSSTLSKWLTSDKIPKSFDVVREMDSNNRTLETAKKIEQLSNITKPEKAGGISAIPERLKFIKDLNIDVQGNKAEPELTQSNPVKNENADEDQETGRKNVLAQPEERISGEPKKAIENDSEGLVKESETSTGELVHQKEASENVDELARTADKAVEESTIEPSSDSAPQERPQTPSLTVESYDCREFGCSHKGTCNWETGKCHCINDRAGPTCNELAMPNCQLAPGYSPACILPNTCACIIDCEKYVFTHSAICYNELNDDGSVETDVNKLYSQPQVIMRLDQKHSGGVAPREEVEDQFKYKGPYGDPQKCPLKCSGRGVCLVNEGRCDCAWGYSGSGCEVIGHYVPFVCLNNCSGHGKCVGYSCVCGKGHFGIDCSLSTDGDGKTQLVTRPPFQWTDVIGPPSAEDLAVRPKIYVYDLPGDFNVWQMEQGPGLDWIEELLFFERMLASKHRTANPEEADFFYIPLYLRARSDRAYLVLPRALEYVKQHFPFYNKSNGLDHFMLTNGDWGNCEVGAKGFGNPLLYNGITVTLWGFTKNMDELRDDNPNMLPCFRKYIDVAMPPVLGGEVFGSSPYLRSSDEPSPERTTLLYFKGFSGKGATNWGPWDWSNGVRQKVFDLFEGRERETGLRIQSWNASNVDFLYELERSIFCLAPSGWGWGMRTTQAVVMGCIPVVIQPDIVQPFEGDILNWSDFAVVLGMDDIPNLPNILKSIPMEEIYSKREAMEMVWPRFVWTSPQYDPFKEKNVKVAPELLRELAEKDAFSSIVENLGKRLPLLPHPPIGSTEGAEGGPQNGEEEASGSREEAPKAEEAAPGDGQEEGPRAEEEREGSGQEEASKKEEEPSKQGEEASEDGGESPTGGEEEEKEKEASKEEEGEVGEPRASTCPSGCGPHGTCNEELQQCFCAGNYAGPTCEERAMPACHLAAGGAGGDAFTPCHLPTSCACTAQCDKYLLHHHGTCYNEQQGQQGQQGQVDVEQLYLGPQAVIDLDGTGNEVGPRVELKRGEGFGDEFVGPARCDENCSGRGVCAVDGGGEEKKGHCLCPWGFRGPNCEKIPDTPFVCFNGCSKHGKCVDASCHCTVGYYGIDCSLFLNEAGKPTLVDRLPGGAPPLAPSPRIYVYELPGQFNSWQFLHSPGLDFQEPVFFLERLLASPHRTADADEADFFFLPLILRNRNLHKIPLLDSAIQYVKDTWRGRWEKHNGADHIVFTNDPWGNCEIRSYGQMDAALQSMVTITLWGMTQKMGASEEAGDGHLACFRYGVDILAPPRPTLLSEEVLFSKVPYLQGKDEEDAALNSGNRKTLLYFRGYPGDFNALENHIVSFGVRQKMFELYGKKEERQEEGESGGGGRSEGIVLEDGDIQSWEGMEGMLNSQFCLCTSDWGWDFHTMQAILLGCIPVVIMPNVLQPFEGELLDWSEFSIRLQWEDIPNVGNILRNVSQADVDAKRAALRREWTRFVWSAPSVKPLQNQALELQEKWDPILNEKDAFSSIMEVLGKRLKMGKGKEWAQALRELPGGVAWKNNSIIN